MRNAVTVLCVADGADETAATLRTAEADLSVTTAETVAAATRLLDDRTESAFDSVVARFDLPDGTAVDVFNHAREVAPDVACVLYDDPGVTDLDFSAAPIFEYVPTTAATAELPRTVLAAVRSRRQRAYPIPAEEDERLAAIERYDVAAEATVAAFERLATVAAHALDAPVAFVGLIEDRHERVLACHGVDAVADMDRGKTACAHTIAHGEVLTVPNMQTDPRFDAVAADGELDVKGYAGVPIETPNGQQVATLCVVDEEERRFTDSDRTVLTLLAEEAGDQVALRDDRPALGAGDPED